MPWKKIGKIASAILLGGGVASGVPSEGLNIPPEMIEQINGLLGAIVALIMLFVSKPTEDK